MALNTIKRTGWHLVNNIYAVAVTVPLLILTGSAYGAIQPPLSRPAIPVAESVIPRLILQDIDRIGDRLIGVGEYGAIVWSDDSGAHWQQSKVPVSVALNSIVMLDKSTGWAVGHGGTILATEDGGVSWAKIFDGAQAAQLMLEQAKALADRGELDEQRLMMAQLMAQDGPDKPFFDLVALDRNRLIVTGAFNLAFITQDGGASWQPLSYSLPNPMEAHLYAIDAVGETVFIAGEFGLVMRSFDGGDSFEALELPYDGSFFDIAYNGRDLVVGGLRGNIFLSRDNGDSWTRVGAGEGASISSIEPLTDSSFLLTDQAGQLWHLDPAQPSDSRYRRLSEGRALPPLTNAVLTQDNQLVVTGVGGIIGPLKLPLNAEKGTEK